MKALVILQSHQAGAPQARTAASENSQPTLSTAAAALGEQLLQRTGQAAKQPQGCNNSYPQTREDLLQQHRINALLANGGNGLDFDKLGQLAQLQSIQTVSPGAGSNLNSQLLHMLKSAGANQNAPDAASLLGKRRLDQVQGVESEAQVRAAMMQGAGGVAAGASQLNASYDDRRVSDYRNREHDSLAQSRALISTLTD